MIGSHPLDQTSSGSCAGGNLNSQRGQLPFSPICLNFIKLLKFEFFFSMTLINNRLIGIERFA